MATSAQRSKMLKSFTAQRVSASPTALDRFANVDQLLKAAEQAEGEGDVTVPSPVIEYGSVDWDTYSAAYKSYCDATNYLPGKVIELAVGDVVRSPYNPRIFYRKKTLEQLALSLVSMGQRHPIFVVPDYDRPGKYFIVDGGRRVQALRHANLPTVRAIVLDMKIDADSYKLGHHLNAQHEVQTVFDNALVWRKMLDDGAFSSQKALGEELGEDETTVSQTLAVGRLPEACIRVMVESDKQFGTNLAYKISLYYERNRNEEVVILLIKKIITEDLSVRDTGKLLSGGSDAKTVNRRRRAENSVPIKIGGVGQVGFMRTYGDDALTLDLKGLPKDTRDKIQVEFKQVLERVAADGGDAKGDQTE
ncbi:ParB/RepB/Spo0J family partition protein [Pandoraea sp. NPDC090278]|uniref:ParB/RepB/Spo0J family partition protein n=1 Tax=Pandoraea sp. NPDC090278 TaxID=3364391 RepID=UPI00383A9166